MALVTSTAIDGALISEVDMGGGSDSTNTTTVRATVVQASTIFYDTPATMDKAERLIADAAGYGSQLVVFPEAFIGGYPRGLNFGVTIGSRSAKGTEQFQKYHTSAIDVPEGGETDEDANNSAVSDDYNPLFGDSPPFYGRECEASSRAAEVFSPEAEDDRNPQMLDRSDESPLHNSLFGMATIDDDYTTFSFAELGLPVEQYPPTTVEAYVPVAVGEFPAGESVSEGPEVDRLAAMAGKHKVFLVMGVIERSGYTLYCTVLFFDPQGQYLGKHRKVMPTALERVIWGFGDGSTIPVYETPIGKIGALICWENRMPLLRTALYGKGIEIYCAPTADAREVWQGSMTHIALEGGCFVLSANQFCRRKDYPPAPDYEFGGTEDELSPDSVVCAGGSVIISPSGAVLAGPNYEGEGLISADLDLGEIVRAKFAFDVVGHYSRPEVLSLTVKDHQLNPVSFASSLKSSSLKL